MLRCKDFHTCVSDKSECEECSRFPLSPLPDLYKPNNRKYCTVDDIDESCVLDDDNDFKPSDCMHCVDKNITDKEQCCYWRLLESGETV